MIDPDDYCPLCDLPRSQCVHGQPPPASGEGGRNAEAYRNEEDLPPGLENAFQQVMQVRFLLIIVSEKQLGGNESDESLPP